MPSDATDRRWVPIGAVIALLAVLLTWALSRSASPPGSASALRDAVGARKSTPRVRAATPAEEDSTVVVVRVVSASGLPVPGCSVALAAARGVEPSSKGLTKADGSFGPVRFPRLTTLHVAATTSIGETVSHDRSLRERWETIVLELPVGGAIRGRVTSSDGNPCEAVAVEAVGGGVARRASTDASGAFELTDLPIGIDALVRCGVAWGPHEERSVRVSASARCDFILSTVHVYGITVHVGDGLPRELGAYLQGSLVANGVVARIPSFSSVGNSFVGHTIGPPASSVSLRLRLMDATRAFDRLGLVPAGRHASTAHVEWSDIPFLRLVLKSRADRRLDVPASCGVFCRDTRPLFARVAADGRLPLPHMGAIGSRLVLLGRLGVFVATPNASGDEIPATEVESAGYDIRVTSVHPEVLRRIAVESTELDGLEIPERTGATEVGLRTFAVAPGTFQVTLDGVPLLQRPVRIGDATPQLTVSVDSIASLGSLRGRAVGGRFLTLARMTGIVGEFVASHALSGAEPFEAGRLASGGYTLRIEFGDGRVLFREFWLDPGENLDVGDLRADDGSQIRCTAVRDLAGRTLQDVRIAPSTGGRIGGIRHPLTGDAVIEVPAGSDVLYSTSRGFAVLPGDRARQPVDLSAPFGGSVTTVEVPDDQPIPSQVLAVGAFRGELWVVDLEATGARRFSLPEALQVYGMVVSTDESWDVMQVEAAQHDRGATLVCGRRLRLAPRVGVDPAESVRIELLRLGGQDVSRLGIELDRGDLGALADDEHAIPEDCEVRIVPYDSGSVRGAIGEFR